MALLYCMLVSILLYGDVKGQVVTSSSANVLWEDLLVARNLNTRAYQGDRADAFVTDWYFFRGSFLIHVDIKEANMNPHYREVAHEDSNDNVAYPQRSPYCTHPVPYAYSLHHNLYQVTTKASESCILQSENSQCCDYLSPDLEPCEKYPVPSNLPHMYPLGQLVCTHPGSLSDATSTTALLGNITTEYADNEERCVTGTLAEFSIFPLFQRDKAACHVEPQPGQVAYDMEYWVELHNGTIVNSRKLSAKKYYDGMPINANGPVKHDFLTVQFDSQVDEKTDMVETDLGDYTAEAGYYRTDGVPVANVPSVPENTATVRPVEPFGVSINTWGDEDCDTDKLDDLVLVANQETGADHSAMRPNPDIKVEAIDEGKFVLMGNGFMNFEIPREESILRHLYEPTSVVEETLHTELVAGEGKLMISGELQECPGYFDVRVMEFFYPGDPLCAQADRFRVALDVGVACPSAFHVEIDIPFEDRAIEDVKHLILYIRDSQREIERTLIKDDMVG